MSASSFAHRHLLGIEQLHAEEILQIIDLADTFSEINEREIKKVPTLRGRTVINLFLEPSTRTRTSFEIAAKRLSADAVNVSGSSSSTTKGESLVDTVRNLAAMRPDVIVIRHQASGAAKLVSENVDAAVVNAGDGTHEHPSQALLDVATIRKHKGRIEGLEIAICGDILHSRVARSDVLALTRLGAKVRLSAPVTMMPPRFAEIAGVHADKVRICHRVEDAIEGADVVMMLRIQLERFPGMNLFPTNREYSRKFGLNRRRLELAKKDAVVMHPGPVNRGVELEPEVMDGTRSVILDQVAYGVAVRMAILYLLGTPGDRGSLSTLS